jgi:hypothetical protein
VKLALAALPLFSLVLWTQPAAPAGKVAVRVGDKPEQTFTEEDLAKMPRHRVSEGTRHNGGIRRIDVVQLRK